MRNIIIFAAFILAAFPAAGQSISGNFSGGSVKVGSDNGTCNSARKGAIQYNNSTNVLEYCNETIWTPMVAGSGTSTDDTPTAFNFTDLTGQTPSAVVYSNTLTIVGFDGPISASTSGASSQISINGGSWSTSASINPGDTLRVRQTTSASVSTLTTATVTVGTVSDSWTATTRASQLRIFTTAGLYLGNFGGLSGADAACQAEAGNLGYTGTYKALLSSSTVNAKDRVTLIYPIVRASDGVTVASSNLWSGTLSNAINPAVVHTMTGTDSAGVKVGSTSADFCSDWTSDASANIGYGNASATTTGWMFSWYYSCNVGLPIFCIEQ